MITEQHVSVPTAKLLAEAGFNEPCKDVYIDATGWDGKGDIFDEIQYPVPTQSLAARWLREKHSLHIAVMPSNKAWYWELRKTNGSFVTGSAHHNATFPTHEEALEAGLREALKFIINQNKTMKKIMFNDKYGLTQAVLDGRKTQTRRIVPQSVIDKYSMMEDFAIIDARYDVGEVVAVAQSYRDCGGVNEVGVPMWEIISQNIGGTNAGWDNKMFVRADLMPHKIRITDVRVERLQNISEEDCLKEGVIKWYAGQRDIPFFCYPNSVKCDYDTPQAAFAHLINKVSRKDVWSENPYVFVYDFELTK